MFFDTHCHIDFFEKPISQAKIYEQTGNCCIAVTMLPSHYQMALTHLNSFKFVRPALGLHPLRSTEGNKEIDLFKQSINTTEYIGEIGLDFSAEGKYKKNIQIEVLRNILHYVCAGKFVSVHSREAHEELAMLLDEFRVGPVCFHYFIGGIEAAVELANKGHYFSINYRMLNGKHRKLLDMLPKEQILVESDGPFLTKKPLEMVKFVYRELSEIWQMEPKHIDELLSRNFNNCRTIV